MKTNQILAIILFSLVASATSIAQTVYPGKGTIDKKEYAGLILSQNIQDKYLSGYWEKFLERFGKVKGRKGVATIQKASIPSISPNPVVLTSLVSTPNKNLTQVFLALQADGQYISGATETKYSVVESILKDFSDFATLSENARLADEMFTSAEKGYQKQIRQNDDTVKEIEKTEKKLIDLKASLEKGKAETEQMLVDLQNKQKALEEAKSKIK